MAQPFLKWAGGKRGLIPELLKYVPEDFNSYWEPFFGGGALFFELESRGVSTTWRLSDVNEELMITYRAVRDDVEGVIDVLGPWSREHSEETYYKMRALEPETDIGIAARMIYLNRTCFNGLYRVNRKGKFNVPFGRYKNPTICNAELLRECSRALGMAKLSAVEFDYAQNADEGDLIYFDPPYVPASSTSDFTAYSEGGFGDKDQVKLRDLAETLIDRNVHVILSNSDTPRVRELYKDSEIFQVHRVEARRNINSKGDKRGTVGELIIVGRSR